MVQILIRLAYKVVIYSMLWTFILWFFGKYVGILVYHANFALFFFLGTMLSDTSIRSIEVYVIFYIMILLFKPKL